MRLSRLIQAQLLNAFLYNSLICTLNYNPVFTKQNTIKLATKIVTVIIHVLDAIRTNKSSSIETK